MDRTRMACYVLLASAFVMAALLVVRMPDKVARAGVVVEKGQYTVHTALTRINEEAVFVIDQRAEKLLIYGTDVPKKRIVLLHTVSLNEMFNGKSVDPGSGRPIRPRP